MRSPRTRETDALWQTQAETQRAIVSKPDYKAKAKPAKIKNANRIRQRISRAHYHLNITYQANSMLATWTESAIPRCQFNDECSV